MKKFITILIALITIVAVAQAQKPIAIGDVFKGKPVLDVAKEHAVEAFDETKVIYKIGMTEDEFVNQCLNAFPVKYKALRDVYVPYAKYLYSFHKRGFTDDQLTKAVTGKEFVDCANGVIAWRKANPGIIPETDSWWRKLIHWIAVVSVWLDETLPQ